MCYGLLLRHYAALLMDLLLNTSVGSLMAHVPLHCETRPGVNNATISDRCNFLSQQPSLEKDSGVKQIVSGGATLRCSLIEHKTVTAIPGGTHKHNKQNRTVCLLSFGLLKCYIFSLQNLNLEIIEINVVMAGLLACPLAGGLLEIHMEINGHICRQVIMDLQ